MFPFVVCEYISLVSLHSFVKQINTYMIIVIIKHAEVNNMIRIGWLQWKEVSVVMCDRKMPVELKDKIFRPAMTLPRTILNVGP